MCMIIEICAYKACHTVELRRTGDRTAEQAIFRAFRTNRRADQTDVDSRHGTINRTRENVDKSEPVRFGFESPLNGV